MHLQPQRACSFPAMWHRAQHFRTRARPAQPPRTCSSAAMWWCDWPTTDTVSGLAGAWGGGEGA